MLINSGRLQLRHWWNWIQLITSGYYTMVVYWEPKAD